MRSNARAATASTDRDAAPRLVPMALAHLDEVVHVEQCSYAFPWTRGNFVDSLAAGHWMQVIRDADGALVAYIVAMPGVEEMHLLNVTVASGSRRCGLATRLLDALERECARRGAKTLWLEVRPGNAEALALYAARGFVEAGRRRGYYPAARGTREDAIVMSCNLQGDPQALPPSDDTAAARSRPTAPRAPT